MTEKEVKKRTKEKKLDILKLKLLVTIVDRNKTIFYMDLIEQYKVNFQMSVNAEGTASAEILKGLGLLKTDKAVIFSAIRDDEEKKILSKLSEKFETIRNGKGVAFTVPFSSIVGVSSYKFLGNILVAGGKKNGK